MFSLFKFFSCRNLNKLSIQYQSHPKSRKIDVFGQEICFCHNSNRKLEFFASMELSEQTVHCFCCHCMSCPQDWYERKHRTANWSSKGYRTQASVWRQTLRGWRERNSDWRLPSRELRVFRGKEEEVLCTLTNPKMMTRKRLKNILLNVSLKQVLYLNTCNIYGRAT